MKRFVIVLLSIAIIVSLVIVVVLKNREFETLDEAKESVNETIDSNDSQEIVLSGEEDKFDVVEFDGMSSENSNVEMNSINENSQVKEDVRDENSNEDSDNPIENNSQSQETKEDEDIEEESEEISDAFEVSLSDGNNQTEVSFFE